MRWTCAMCLHTSQCKLGVHILRVIMCCNTMQSVPSALHLIMCCFTSAECIMQYNANCNCMAQYNAKCNCIVHNNAFARCKVRCRCGAKTVRDSTSPSPVHLDRCLMLEITAQDRFVHLCQITLIFCGAADTVCDGIIMILHGNGGSYREKQRLTLISLKHV